MRHNPNYAVTDERVVRQLIADNPWATIVSHDGAQLVASHYPVLLDEAADGLALVTHVGRPDEQVHRFRDAEVMADRRRAARLRLAELVRARGDGGADLELQRRPTAGACRRSSTATRTCAC